MRTKELNYYIAFIIFLCNACGFAHVEELVKNYFLIAIDTHEDMSLSYSLKDQGSFIAIVPGTVFAVGYNDQFIVVKQHPREFPKAPDRSTTNYFIIPLINRINPSEDKNVIGPLTTREFKAKSIELGIPKSLEFTKVFNELE